MKTLMVNPQNVERRWKIVDAEGKVMGRVASEVARILMGKNKAICSPNVDTGDFVVVINAGKVVLTGNKANQKKYFHHTGHLGGERWETYLQLIQDKPTEPLTKAIWGMLPHTNLGREMFKKLKIYAGSEHPHSAQKPEVVTV
jgi:large subunit ribosomal protein L13